MLDLLRERVYWPSMAKDAQSWATNCHRCQVAWGDYNQPKPKISHLEAHNPLDLVCLDLLKSIGLKQERKTFLSSPMHLLNLALQCALLIKQQKL